MKMGNYFLHTKAQLMKKNTGIFMRYTKISAIRKIYILHNFFV